MIVTDLSHLDDLTSLKVHCTNGPVMVRTVHGTKSPQFESTKLRHQLRAVSYSD